MKTNVEKVLERDQKLSELDDRADALQQGASQFEQQAGKLKRKFWLQNLKMMIIMGVIGIIVIAIIIGKCFREYFERDALTRLTAVNTATAIVSMFCAISSMYNLVLDSERLIQRRFLKCFNGMAEISNCSSILS
ncbi:Synaptobrevin [Ooceraea biroi]|uniref:Synaptobrevin n=1 Tax=Ooceraea biroi TaxID=2015173 RepID=A0A026VZI1_OOCBI|nr:Synaptobrevin [Ooceraea biroi]